MSPTPFDENSISLQLSSLPLRGRIVECLADLLWLADETIELIASDPSGYKFSGCNEELRRVFDRVNELMCTMCD